ncbi:stage V sporulation T C-terminal domain-containing protein [uncultured Gemmiger sp.]|uniref:stage V sporulation T C-terminal domain-containing protein n=1 Tax=uncultured Gemmiger sp. TaxID=1623490 RepID=UPI002804959B|nr:stage V sporulation T C-terminal domain-containing protein [uncultured Gemmiger sp.]
MKATGIVRRIDELGRIVIPKEIRRTQRIRQGDSLEIFTAADGEVVFKKYSPLSGLGSLSKVYAEVLAKSLGRPVVVCDTHQIVAAAGPGRGELLDRAISPELEQLLAARSVYTAPADRTRRLPMLERSERPILCAAPILAHGDIEGGVLLPGTGRDALPEEEAVHAVATAAAFLAKWMEE